MNGPQAAEHGGQAAPKCSRGELELIGYQVAGVAQTLHAFAVSDLFKHQEDALELLFIRAREAADYIAAHVQAMGIGPLPE